VDLRGKVVVIGGGLVGAETAEHLAVHGCEVTVVEMLPEIAAEMASAPKVFLMESLAKNNVALCPNTKVLEIADHDVIVEHNGIQQLISADLVVMAIGSRSNKQLFEQIENKYKVTVVGDAGSVGKALDGIDAAYHAALEI
jgi:NADPH-dependent 2,4-dienoyl-CoA reductase/sulfur reductase-like enzyme